MRVVYRQTTLFMVAAARHHFAYRVLTSSRLFISSLFCWNVLVAGQDIRVREFRTNTWQPAKVIMTEVHPRSYNVLTPTGNVLRRNLRHLRKTSERHATSTFQQNNDDDTRIDGLTLRVDMRSDASAQTDDVTR